MYVCFWGAIRPTLNVVVHQLTNPRSQIRVAFQHLHALVHCSVDISESFQNSWLFPSCSFDTAGQQMTVMGDGMGSVFVKRPQQLLKTFLDSVRLVTKNDCLENTPGGLNQYTYVWWIFVQSLRVARHCFLLPLVDVRQHSLLVHGG